MNNLQLAFQAVVDEEVEKILNPPASYCQHPSLRPCHEPPAVYARWIDGQNATYCERHFSIEMAALEAMGESGRLFLLKRI